MSERLTKTDLERILEIVHIFDKLQPNSDYTYRQIVELAGVPKSKVNDYIGSLRRVDRALELLEQTGYISHEDDPSIYRAGLYLKKCSSAEIKVKIKTYLKHFSSKKRAGKNHNLFYYSS